MLYVLDLDGGQDKKELSYFFHTLRYFHFSFHLYQTSCIFSSSTSFVTGKPSIGSNFNNGSSDAEFV